ncbi:MAG: PilZ domain-containing protein [Candidatus Omnitrophota bacterium]
MTDEYAKDDRREFLRYDFSEPLSYKTIKSPRQNVRSPELVTGDSRNLSASGVLFVTGLGNVPDISSILLMDLDRRAVSICREIEEQAFMVRDRILGKVVRLEDNDDGTCSIGVAFLKKSSPLTKDLESLLD